MPASLASPPAPFPPVAPGQPLSLSGVSLFPLRRAASSLLPRSPLSPARRLCSQPDAGTCRLALSPPSGENPGHRDVLGLCSTGNHTRPAPVRAWELWARETATERHEHHGCTGAGIAPPTHRHRAVPGRAPERTEKRLSALSALLYTCPL